MQEVYIVSAVRTPIGSFNGALSGLAAPKIGAAAIKAAIERIKLNPAEVEQVYMGSVLQGNLGQAPARQAAKFAGLPNETQCTIINKICASGMKSVVIAAQNIMLGDAEVVVASGMENIYHPKSNYYTKRFACGQHCGYATCRCGRHTKAKNRGWWHYNRGYSQ